MTARAARRIVVALLGRLHTGELTIVEGGRRHVFGAGVPRATVEVHSERFWAALLHGSRGLAESYADGLWDSPDLAAVIRVAARNVDTLDELRRRIAPVRGPVAAGPRDRRAQHAARAAAATSPPTTTSATSSTSSCSTRR